MSDWRQMICDCLRETDCEYPKQKELWHCVGWSACRSLSKLGRLEVLVTYIGLIDVAGE